MTESGIDRGKEKKRTGKKAQRGTKIETEIGTKTESEIERGKEKKRTRLEETESERK